MTWNDISHLQGKKFRRATGIYRRVFEDMVQYVSDYKTAKRKHPTRGNPKRQSVENQVLLCVLYWREYRSQENLGLEFRLTQSRVSRIIDEIELILIRSNRFVLPGKKALKTENGEYEVVIVDVTETPTERPKKNKKISTVAKKSDIH